jgi:hypothetical protein
MDIKFFAVKCDGKIYDMAAVKYPDGELRIGGGAVYVPPNELMSLEARRTTLQIAQACWNSLDEVYPQRCLFDLETWRPFLLDQE